jgi:hypothetical protein
VTSDPARTVQARADPDDDGTEGEDDTAEQPPAKRRRDTRPVEDDGEEDEVQGDSPFYSRKYSTNLTNVNSSMIPIEISSISKGFIAASYSMNSWKKLNSASQSIKLFCVDTGEKYEFPMCEKLILNYVEWALVKKIWIQQQ